MQLFYDYLLFSSLTSLKVCAFRSPGLNDIGMSIIAINCHDEDFYFSKFKSL